MPEFVAVSADVRAVTFHQGGDSHTYESRAAFRAGWMAIKQPYIPERELPVPDYSRRTYAICVVGGEADLHIGGTGTAPVVGVYMNGEVYSIDRLFDALTAGLLWPARPGARRGRRPPGTCHSGRGPTPPPSH